MLQHICRPKYQILRAIVIYSIPNYKPQEDQMMVFDKARIIAKLPLLKEHFSINEQVSGPEIRL